MTRRAEVEEFLGQKALAVVGVSRSGKKFGNIAYRELRAKGYRIYPVHPSAERIEGDRCYPSLQALPEPVGGALVVVPPAQTERVLRDVVHARIPRVWLQWGAESPEALRYCAEQGIRVVHGHCVLMFAEPCTPVHRVHRWIWGALGRLPARA